MSKVRGKQIIIYETRASRLLFSLARLSLKPYSSCSKGESFKQYKYSLLLHSKQKKFDKQFRHEEKHEFCSLSLYYDIMMMDIIIRTTIVFAYYCGF